MCVDSPDFPNVPPKRQKQPPRNVFHPDNFHLPDLPTPLHDGLPLKFLLQRNQQPVRVIFYDTFGWTNCHHVLLENHWAEVFCAV